MKESFTEQTIALNLAEELASSPLGGYLKNQSASKIQENSFEFELDWVEDKDKGRKFKVTVDELPISHPVCQHCIKSLLREEKNQKYEMRF